MDLTHQSAVESERSGVVSEEMESPPSYVSAVDSFLVEALQNPRHRLTILRMELDIKKFLQNPDTQQFEFPHFPTSYLRLAAHRVAQHYGLQTMVQDNSLDGQGIRILVIKKPDSKFPSTCLSDVPAKELENDKLDKVKISIQPRPKSSLNNVNGLGLKRSPVRSVEERKEEYDRARARIFSSSEMQDVLSEEVSDVMNLNVVEEDICKNFGVDMDKGIYTRETSNSSRVAILRDIEKDRTDPDYDRSYDRYVRGIPNMQSFNMVPYNMPSFQPPFVHYDPAFPRLGQMPAPQTAINYGTPVMPPYSAVGFNQPSRDAVYMQWPTQSMMYAQSHDHLRHAIFQAPICQQPLSFDYLQSHR